MERPSLQTDRDFVVGIELFSCSIAHIADSAGDLHSLGDIDHDLGGFRQERLGVLPALTELLALVGVPSAGLLHDPEFHRDIQQRALTADAMAVHDVELSLTKRRSNLVLHDLHPGAGTGDLDTIFDGLDPTNVEPDR